MTCFKVLIIFIIGSIPCQAFCQATASDSIMLDDKVVVEAPRLEEYAVGVSVQQIDSSKLSIYKSQSISNLLSSETGVTIKSYGAGGLSTPSIRGGSSNHTPVLWNGINLQNSMNGSSSLSLIPATFFDEVVVQYGGGSTLFGSGVVSGAIHINTSPLSLKRDHIQVNAGTGSFGDRTVSGDIKHGIGNWHSDLKVFYREAKNDFEYVNTSKFGQPKERQTNAAFNTLGITQNNEVNIGKFGNLTTSVWYNHYDKDLQSLMVQGVSRASQEDNSLRANVTYLHSKSNNPLKVKSAFLYDELLYTNPDLTNPTSNHYTHSWINELEKRLSFGQKHDVNLGLNYAVEKAVSDGLTDAVVRNRISLFGNYRLNKIAPNLNTSLNFRQEIVDGSFIPTVLSGGFDYLVQPFLMLKVNASKNYRIPTFNDLYWRTDTYSSGNPNLQPESGYNLDFGLKEFISNDNFTATFGQDFYWTHTNNWIIWLPNEKGQWKPENKETGKSYGAEITYKSALKLNNFELFSDGFFKYSIATLTEKKDANNERSVWYEPKYSFRGTIGVDYKGITLSYNHNYFSERQYDNQNTLDPYHLGAVFLAYEYHINKNLINLSLNVNNVWNADYQVVAWYAMPPTNYQLNISYQLNL